MSPDHEKYLLGALGAAVVFTALMVAYVLGESHVLSLYLTKYFAETF